ncbi:MAG TPA: 50S ribosomal protein L30 [Gemmatimonadota bacterium]
MARLRITQSRSEIGHPATLRRTLRALGLRGYQRTVEHEDTPQVRGMIRRVSHLVTVAESEANEDRTESAS